MVAAIVATFRYTSGKRALQKNIDDASISCLMQLEELIRNSVKEGEYKALAKCEAFREPLEGMQRELSSEIDLLTKFARQGADGRKEAFATIEALQASWRSKRRSIESETRRLLALLGVE